MAKALYIHWPFCLAKCPYCDFNSHVRDSVDHAAWQAALLADMRHEAELAGGEPLDSVFFGGGTPSLMPPALVARLLEEAEKLWGFAEGIEITLEGNPSSVEAANYADLAKAGINRASLGLQALDDATLRFLGRLHDASEGLAALDVAQRRFGRVTFDLIYARPEQSVAEWQRELERALNGSGPFAVELESLDKLLDAAQPDPSIAQLRTRATTGIPTRAILLARFDAAAAAIVRADAASDVAPGWAGRSYAFVMSLVMIRPLGEREGLDAPSRVARAQMRLEEGDLDAAVKELGELEDAAAKAAAPWLTDARARLAAEQALAQLSATLTQRLNEAATSTPVTPVENAGE